MESDVVGFCRLADGTGFAPSFLVHTIRGSHLFHVCACISCGQCSRYRWMARPVPEQVLGSISLRVGMSLQLELLAQGTTVAISEKPRPMAISMISSKQNFRRSLRLQLSFHGLIRCRLWQRRRSRRRLCLLLATVISVVMHTLVSLARELRSVALYIDAAGLLPLSK